MKAASHDTHVEFREVAPPSDRKFGVTVGAILVALGAIRALLFGHTGTATTILLAVGASLMLLGLIAPRVLGPVNRGWMALGMLLAAIVNPIIMLLMFVVLFVPIGLAMRATKRDTLQLRRRPAGQSYWHSRVNETSTGGLSDQF
jgi:hypothetical protein